MMLNIFSCIICHLYNLFGEVSACFCPFSNCIVCFHITGFESSLYVPDIRPLSDMCFVNTFPQSVIYLFIFLIVTFAELKFLKILMRYNLSIFPLVGHSFGVKSKNSLSSHIGSENFLLYSFLEVL
uniref:Uncharacterized protein n=1 Tax=Myotis myotis TaxID=51298 RepID=A0A7J7V3P8_MYOMY|nr:hypothetical protein mMyoMyo1_008517 [Myotis myotis]